MELIIAIAALCSAQYGYSDAAEKALNCQKWYLDCNDRKWAEKNHLSTDLIIIECIRERKEKW